MGIKKKRGSRYFCLFFKIKQTPFLCLLFPALASSTIMCGLLPKDDCKYTHYFITMPFLETNFYSKSFIKIDCAIIMAQKGTICFLRVFVSDMLECKQVKKKKCFSRKTKKTLYVIDIQRLEFCLVPRAGVEPARVLPHWCLRPTRLPIPPSGRQSGCKGKSIFWIGGKKSDIFCQNAFF